MRCSQVDIKHSYTRLKWTGTAAGGGVAYGRFQSSNPEFVHQRRVILTYDVGTLQDSNIVSASWMWIIILLDKSNTVTGLLDYWRGTDGSLDPGIFLEQSKHSELYGSSFPS